uniref:Uncharacterized protein n=1 Tax=Arundo donax TaxID=35708 RepID=A0A0A8XU88_ARUDO
MTLTISIGMIVSCMLWHIMEDPHGVQGRNLANHTLLPQPKQPLSILKPGLVSRQHLSCNHHTISLVKCNLSFSHRHGVADELLGLPALAGARRRGPWTAAAPARSAPAAAPSAAPRPRALASSRRRPPPRAPAKPLEL